MKYPDLYALITLVVVCLLHVGCGCSLKGCTRDGISVLIVPKGKYFLDGVYSVNVAFDVEGRKKKFECSFSVEEKRIFLWSCNPSVSGIDTNSFYKTPYVRFPFRWHYPLSLSIETQFKGEGKVYDVKTIQYQAEKSWGTCGADCRFATKEIQM